MSDMCKFKHWGMFVHQKDERERQQKRQTFYLWTFELKSDYEKGLQALKCEWDV